METAWIAPGAVSLIGLPITFWLASHREHRQWVRSERFRVGTDLLRAVDEFIRTQPTRTDLTKRAGEMVRTTASTVADLAATLKADPTLTDADRQAAVDRTTEQINTATKGFQAAQTDSNTETQEIMRRWRAAQSEADLVFSKRAITVLEDRVYEALMDEIGLQREALAEVDEQDHAQRVATARQHTKEMRKELLSTLRAELSTNTTALSTRARSIK